MMTDKKDLAKIKNNKINEDKQEIVKDKININNINFQKPFLKWVGGKTQILTNILNNYPIKIDTYHEIFLGGGSVLLGLLTLKENNIIDVKNINAYDLNKPLIYLYKNIQNNCKKLIKEIKKIVDIYKNINGEIINRKPININDAKTSQESYYYWIRKEYNNMNEEEKISILGSAYFLFLNKTCFRGLYRVGPKGFNVPFGHYKNPSIYEKENIENISEMIKDVNFIHSSFEKSLLNIKKNDMVYCDPPYVPINVSSFVSYTIDGFEGLLHEKLFKILQDFDNKKIKWIMSNSYTDLVLNSFNDKKKYTIEKILCRRKINSKNPESKINEVIIKSQ